MRQKQAEGISPPDPQNVPSFSLRSLLPIFLLAGKRAVSLYVADNSLCWSLALAKKDGVGAAAGGSGKK